MSHPNPTHDPENVYPADEMSFGKKKKAVAKKMGLGHSIRERNFKKAVERTVRKKNS